MATRVVAPSMGEGIEELTVVNWLKKEGDTVKEFDVLVEMETDKVTNEIPSPAAGTLLKILAQKEEVVKVGATLAWIGNPGEKLEGAEPTAKAVIQPKAPETPEPAAKTVDQPKTPEATKPAAEAVIPAEAPKPATVAIAFAAAKTQYSGPVTPLVKKLAATKQVDLNLVKGTGKDGRITKEDVLNYLETSKVAPPVAVAAAPVPEQKVETGAPIPTPSIMAGELIPLTSVRKQIAERMVYSQQTSPHVLSVMEADLSKVMAHRSANKDAYAAQGINLTLTPYFCAAIVSGIKAVPEINSSWTDEGIQRYSVINLGMATALGEAGLIVPVIKDAGSLSLQGLAQRINDLSTRARTKKLLPDDVKGGTFTLTNHGSGGSLFASPIIFQPQAAILGTGMMQKRAVVVTDASGNDALAIRPMIYLSLVFDHRILDGEIGDRFLKKVKETLENWS